MPRCVPEEEFQKGHTQPATALPPTVAYGRVDSCAAVSSGAFLQCWATGRARRCVARMKRTCRRSRVTSFGL